jgi:hypothetical protein
MNVARKSRKGDMSEWIDRKKRKEEDIVSNLDSRRK